MDTYTLHTHPRIGTRGKAIGAGFPEPKTRFSAHAVGLGKSRPGRSHKSSLAAWRNRAGHLDEDGLELAMQSTVPMVSRRDPNCDPMRPCGQSLVRTLRLPV